MNKARSNFHLQICHLTNSFLFCHTNVESVKTIWFFDVKVASMCADTCTHHKQTQPLLQMTSSSTICMCRTAILFTSNCRISGTALLGRQKSLLNCKPLFLLLFSNSAYSFELCLAQKPFLRTKWNLQKLCLYLLSFQNERNTGSKFLLLSLIRLLSYFTSFKFFSILTHDFKNYLAQKVFWRSLIEWKVHMKKKIFHISVEFIVVKFIISLGNYIT